ncbi:hypothetical protein, conserved [Eimeria necatrix]|uniref:Uncharacterized protein n=1 Tax=Eimeria necatrix TaxID=51315 RepID=U6MM49_9EIME|nr:hypothetical protein, conserved [Eimeria necatrix]CDJ64143.1 hypothetical protein, conserved [Eimeria necatrix]
MPAALFLQEQDLQTLEDVVGEERGPGGLRNLEDRGHFPVPLDFPKAPAPHRQRRRTGLGLGIIYLLVVGLVVGRRMLAQPQGAAAAADPLEAADPAAPLPRPAAAAAPAAAGAPSEDRPEQQQQQQQQQLLEAEELGPAARPGASKGKSRARAAAEAAAAAVSGRAQQPAAAAVAAAAAAARGGAEVEAKLKNVREMLGAAGALVEALATPEASRLLLGAEEELRKAEKLEKEFEEAAAVEVHVENALKELRRLHAAALREGRALEEENEQASHILPLWDPESETDPPFLINGQYDLSDSVQRMLHTFTSVTDMSQELCEDFNDVSRSLLICGQFDCEGDSELLRDAANYIRYLKHNLSAQQGIKHVADRLRETIFAGVKSRELRKREASLVLLQDDTVQLQIFVRLAKADEKSHLKSPAGMHEGVAPLEVMLGDAETLLATMRMLLKEIENCNSMETMFVAAGQFDEIGLTAMELMQTVQEHAATLPKHFGGIEKHIRVSVVADSGRIHEACVSKSKAVLEVLENAKKKLEKGLQSDQSPKRAAAKKLDSGMYEQLLGSVQEATDRLKQTVLQTAETLQTMQQVEDVGAVLNALEAQEKNMLDLLRQEEEAHLLVLDTVFLDLVAEEIGKLELSAAFSKSCELAEAFGHKQYLKLHLEQFEKARLHLRDSRSAVGVVGFMGLMRSAVSSMHKSIAFSNKRQALSRAT